MSNPFDEIERLLGGLGWELESGWSSTTVAVDVEDRDEAYVVTADLPGFGKEDVEVSIADATLLIAAERETEETEEEPNYVRRERRSQSVSRSIRLPGPVDDEAISAAYQHGVLTVTLPKVDAEVGGIQIDIE